CLPLVEGQLCHVGFFNPTAEKTRDVTIGYEETG
ncbi:unnamed protein product, partial [marine sediment metagenome]